MPLTTFALDRLKPLRELKKTLPPRLRWTASVRWSLRRYPLRFEKFGRTREVTQVPCFQQRDLRRTVETTLQKLGIDKELRAHLLSHGRTRGVQGRHYERYDFLDEKRRALRKWAGHLERIIDGKQQSKVAAMHAASRWRGIDRMVAASARP